jgi:diguanylate cyclase (GGDEF)-like protein
LNRRSFDNAYARELQRTKRAKNHLFVMLLDIDHFKKINDQYGHAAGDQALKQLVSICKSTLRKTDVLARIGGEEFAILSPADDAAEAMTMAERLRENVMAITVAAAAGVFSFTASIGVAEADPGENTSTGVLARADQALYEAKRSGRNRVIRNLE